MEDAKGFQIGKIKKNETKGTDPFEYVWSGKTAWFSTAFGPFRRFSGGDKDWSKVYYSNPRAAAHLSVFGEDVALTESLEWLMQLKFQSFESNSLSIKTLESIIKFINEGGVLPHNVKLKEITSSGVIFIYCNGNMIEVTQLSDGFRSLLSLIFELIHQLVKTYDEQTVFLNINNGEMNIPLPGVVLIDEIDAHLHPTWLTRVGQWFTKYFPNMQFIVTTHSPLVCRACEKGSIWRLAAPGSDMESGEVTGIERNRLINGNVLDAYGTEIFGENVAISKESNTKLTRLAELNIKSIIGTINDEEYKELESLKTIFPTE